MKEILSKFLFHPLISGSIIVTLGSLIANFINFLFNLVLSRNLSVQDYGTVASLIAIITLFGISSGAIIPTIVSFTSKSFLKKDFNHIKGVYFKIARPLLLLSGGVLLFFLVFSNSIAAFLNIENGQNLIYLTGLIIFFGFAGVLNLALFQANLSFKLLSGLNIFASSMKLILGIVLILFGLNSVGVMIAILLSYVLPYLLGFNFLRFLLNKGTEKVNVRFSDLLKYGAPSGIALLALTSLSSADLVLVKHLFDTDSAGIYAGLSLIGKVIFFFTAPIGMVMFPLLTRKKENKEPIGSIVPMSLVLVGISSLSITVFYFMFPAFTINFFLKNPSYLIATQYLGFFGIFMTLYSMCSVMMYYFLSIRKIWIYKPIFVAAIFQICGIYFFHKDFATVIFISVLSALSLFVFLFVYYFRVNKNNI